MNAEKHFFKIIRLAHMYSIHLIIRNNPHRIINDPINNKNKKGSDKPSGCGMQKISSQNKAHQKNMIAAEANKYADPEAINSRNRGSRQNRFFTEPFKCRLNRAFRHWHFP